MIYRIKCFDEVKENSERNSENSNMKIIYIHTLTIKMISVVEIVDVVLWRSPVNSGMRDTYKFNSLQLKIKVTILRIITIIKDKEKHAKYSCHTT